MDCRGRTRGTRHDPRYRPGRRSPNPAGHGDRAALARADYTSLGLSVHTHPIALAREALAAEGVIPIERLPGIANGTRIEIAGVVTHRKRPPTARGVTFLSLEDETGIGNVICTPGLWARWRPVATGAKAMRVRGTIEHTSDATEGAMPNLIADKLTPLDLQTPTGSFRDFR